MLKVDPCFITTIRAKIIGGADPFYLKFWVIHRFSVDIRS